MEEFSNGITESELNLADIAREASQECKKSSSPSPPCKGESETVKRDVNSKINLLIDTLNFSMKTNMNSVEANDTENGNDEDGVSKTGCCASPYKHNGSMLSAAETLLKIKQYQSSSTSRHFDNEEDADLSNGKHNGDEDEDDYFKSKNRESSRLSPPLSQSLSSSQRSPVQNESLDEEEQQVLKELQNDEDSYSGKREAFCFFSNNFFLLALIISQIELNSSKKYYLPIKFRKNG